MRPCSCVSPVFYVCKLHGVQIPVNCMLHPHGQVQHFWRKYTLQISTSTVACLLTFLIAKEATADHVEGKLTWCFTLRTLLHVNISNVAVIAMCTKNPPRIHLLLIIRRRLECYRCCVAKPAHAAVVTVQPDAPSHILKVSGLEQHIRYVLNHITPVLCIRLHTSHICSLCGSLLLSVVLPT